MGAVSFSLDPQLVQCLQTALPLDVLVETGTFRGDTVATLEPYFTEIHTVELSSELFRQASRRFAKNERVQVNQGDSAQFLKKNRRRFQHRSVLYWLDAHWCVAAGTSGQASQCPLLDELRSIRHIGEQSVILIDDARLYLCPPPEPHETSQWPTFQAILATLTALSRTHEVMVVNDVIAFFPPVARDALHEYSRKHSVNWLLVMNKAKTADATRIRSAELRKVVDHQRQKIEHLRKQKTRRLGRAG